MRQLHQGHDHQELMAAILDFDVDGEPCALSFAQRLARENRWKPAYAERVVDEYRRFIVLICFAGHPVTPSREVDEAWHLHLTYTDSYWRRLCREIVGRELHHCPTKGGAAEDAKFRAWYAQTLASYKRIFGAAPPRDIWPPVETRFAPLQRLRKKSWLRLAGLGTAVFGAVALMSYRAFAQENGPETVTLDSDTLFLYGFAIFFAVVIVYVVIKLIKHGGKGRGGGGWCGGWGGCIGAGCGSGCGGGGCGGGGCGG